MPDPRPNAGRNGRRLLLGLGGAALAAAAAVAALFWWRAQPPQPLDDAAFAAAYAAPLPPPDGPLRTFHLGHSLVGRDMPAMLSQLSGAAYEHQLGWGTSLREHWEPGLTINGFEVENATDRFRPAREAVASGDYGAVVLTEMVEIRAAIRYHDSPRYLALWAAAAQAANPGTRVFLYESWHPTDDPEGWLERLDRDLARYWEGGILRRALSAPGVDRPIHVIPAGQVMAAFVRAVEGQGGVPGIRDRHDLFAFNDQGQRDGIHFNDLGAYLVALTHYAVIYQRDPRGLPFALNRADGTPAEAPSPEAAALMQEVVWDVVRRYAPTGVPQADPAA